MRSIISSVFPPTTTTATVTMETGLSPVEHGWLGWSLYFEEIGSNVDIFPNTLSRSEGIPAACYHVAGKYLPFESIGTKISKATEGRVKAYTVSPFSSFRIQSMDEIFQTIEDLCNEEGEKNIYIVIGRSRIAACMNSVQMTSELPLPHRYKPAIYSRLSRYHGMSYTNSVRRNKSVILLC
jgi:hypothetical protein